MAVCQCLFAPWITFCVVYATTSFHLHYSKPWLCWLIVGIFSFVVLALGMVAFVSIRAKLKHDESREPTWFVFLFVTMAIAVVVGATLGNMNFWGFMQRYYDYSNLNDYKHVNVAKMKGAQLMDGARVSFVEGTVLDLRKAMSFKNL